MSIPCKVYREQISRIDETFPLHDALGRVVGYSVAIWRTSYVPDLYGTHLMDGPSEFFTVRPYQYRDGEAYGIRPLKTHGPFTRLTDAQHKAYMLMDMTREKWT